MRTAADRRGQGLAGRVLDRRFAGSATFYRVQLADGREALVQGGPADAAPGDPVRLALAGEAVAYPAEGA